MLSWSYDSQKGPVRPHGPWGIIVLAVILIGLCSWVLAACL